ncbi:hypothetical protein BJ138DRAFT_1019048, partial [Hygrophoropsis aurantiaca]
MAKTKTTKTVPRFANTRCLIAHSHAPRVRMSPQMQAALKKRRHDTHTSEEQDIRSVLDYIDQKATELATKFRRSRRQYLEWFYVGSAVRRSKRTKTSAWHAFMHFKGLSVNSNKDFGEKSTIANLVQDTTEYHKLSDSQKVELVEKFDQIKANAMDRPPTLNAHSRAAEGTSSFDAVTTELTALKTRVGAEAFVIMVRGSTDLNFAPKVFITSEVVEKFLRVYLRKDPMEMAVRFESAMLSDGIMSGKCISADIFTLSNLNISWSLLCFTAKVSNKPDAAINYNRYESIVATYKAKIVGWTHPEWANQSDMRGGAVPLEALARAIEDGTCRFVAITQDEIDERAHRIRNGEVLTPECDQHAPEQPGSMRPVPPSSPRAPSHTATTTPMTSSSTTPP